MNKIILRVFPVLFITGLLGFYIPDGFATGAGGPFPPPGEENPQLEICNGNSALAQTGNNAAEQETEQGQAGDTEAQSVSPEFNALTGNNLGVEAQQNGECIPTFEQPPTDSTIPRTIE